MGMPRWPAGTSSSRGLMRISVASGRSAKSSLMIRIDGMCRPAAQLDDDRAELGGRTEPCPEPSVLGVGLRRVPAAVAEHQDVRPRRRAAIRASRQRRYGPHRRLVDRDLERVGREDADAAVVQALHRADGPVDLDDPVRVEPGALEMAVDVGREDEPAVRRSVGPAAQDGEPLVRRGATVQAHPVAVEAPGQLGILGEPLRVGDGRELEPEPLVGGIGLPEALRTAEVGQAAVDAHPRAGADQDGVGQGD